MPYQYIKQRAGNPGSSPRSFRAWGWPWPHCYGGVPEEWCPGVHPAALRVSKPRNLKERIWVK